MPWVRGAPVTTGLAPTRAPAQGAGLGSRAIHRCRSRHQPAMCAKYCNTARSNANPEVGLCRTWPEPRPAQVRTGEVVDAPCDRSHIAPRRRRGRGATRPGRRYGAMATRRTGTPSPTRANSRIHTAADGVSLPPSSAPSAGSGPSGARIWNITCAIQACRQFATPDATRSNRRPSDSRRWPTSLRTASTHHSAARTDVRMDTAPIASAGDAQPARGSHQPAGPLPSSLRGVSRLWGRGRTGLRRRAVSLTPPSITSTQTLYVRPDHSRTAALAAAATVTQSRWFTDAHCRARR
jgi:hypothetical protein